MHRKLKIPFPWAMLTPTTLVLYLATLLGLT